MTDVDAFGLHAHSWQFLSAPDEYVEASLRTARPLLLPSTRRQFATARAILERLNGSNGEPARKGTLLADDVGLGKTTVAALVAWVVAGKGKSVRVLAPNTMMTRRWAEELRLHLPMLNTRASHLRCTAKQVRAERVGRLTDGTIQVTTHSWASQNNTLRCDLLIVDEAHRAKNDQSAFSKALRRESESAGRVLILTATPLSIDAAELERMLELVGGGDASEALRRYSGALQRFYTDSPSGPVDSVAEKLASRAEAAIEGLTPFVIRHGVVDLPHERESFGKQVPWPLSVRSVSGPELELLLRMDRVSRITRRAKEEARERTNDARYHVGWEHLRSEAGAMREWWEQEGPDDVVAHEHLARIESAAQSLPSHPKMQAVAEVVAEQVQAGEKVLLFCFHHATAQELTRVLVAALPKERAALRGTRANWRAAWTELLRPILGDDATSSDPERLRDTFVAWLCTDGLRRQIEGWIDPRHELAEPAVIQRVLEHTNPRGGTTSIAEAAHALFRHLVDVTSRSTLGVLRSVGDARGLHGADGSRVVGICDPPQAGDQTGFLGEREPDFAIAVFNSPFGPDALVSTDKLSEGVDLHRWCRLLVHYELSASPIRTIQRNGRLRRVNSWAATTGKPLQIAYPAFGGTRDQRMVSIMQRRVDAFSMLLGGVPAFDLDMNEGDERWRSEVVSAMRKKLERLNGRLAVRAT